MEKHKFAIKISDEQRETLMAFMQYNDWSFEVVDHSFAEEDAASQDPTLHEYPMERHQPGGLECTECFCSPCVTNDTNRQLWWPTHCSDPHSGNASQRKNFYQRFWAMLANCGAWHDPRYEEKKRLARKSKTTWHKRELMPDCVLNKCRTWLPNPPKQPYMGHKWN